MGEKSTLQIDKILLNTFWQLAESDEKGINKATETLLERLDVCQKKIESGKIGSELAYTLRRLVKGLSSSRESARLGYSVALCQLLRKFAVVGEDDVLGSIKKNLRLSKSDSKSEVGSKSLGKVLAYMSLIQTGKLTEDKLYKVTKKLLALREKKSYLQQICTNSIVLVVSQITTKQFETHIWPQIVTDLQVGWEECTPDTLHLLIVSTRHHYEAIGKKFLKTHWQALQIICEKTFPKVWKVLLKCAEMYPVTHAVTVETLKAVKSSDLSVADFWAAGIDLLYERKEKSKGIMRRSGFQVYMLSNVCKYLTSTDNISAVLDDRVIDNLVRIVDGKHSAINPLLPTGKTVLSSLVTFSKECDDGHIQVTILKKFTESKVRWRTEINSFLENLRQNLNEEGANLYWRFLLQTFTDNVSCSDDGKKEVPSTVFDIVSQVNSLVTLTTTLANHAWQLELLQFLALHSFWTVNKSCDIMHCDKELGTIDDKLRKIFQNHFFKSLDKLLRFKSERSKLLSLSTYIDTMYNLVQYLQTLLRNEGAVTLATPMSDEMKGEWSMVLQVVEDIRKHDRSKSDTNQAFQLLLLNTQIQLLHDPENSISLLQDVILCHEKVMTKKKKTPKKNTEEPAWIDVMTDLLISMMSQDSILARDIAKNVYSSLSENFTPASVKLITDVLAGEAKGEEEIFTFIEDDKDMAVEEDDEEEDMEQQENGEAGGDDEEDESESTEEEDSDEDDEDVDEGFKERVKSALGKAAVVNSDDDNEDEEDLSDSEMFKLDEALGAAFKRRMRVRPKEDKKKKLRQLTVFKLRVMDLVEEVIKSQPSADIVMVLLLPLLELMLLKEKKKEVQDLGFRAIHLCRMLYTKVKVLGDTMENKDGHFNTMEQVIKFSGKVTSAPMIEVVSNMCLLVIRLLLNLEVSSVGPSPARTRSQRASKTTSITKEEAQADIHNKVIDIIKGHLVNFLQKKDSKLNSAFFTNMFRKYPVLFWPVTEPLLEALTDDEVKVYCKTQACSMLLVMLNHSSMDLVGEEAWKEFTDNLKEKLNEVIMEMSAESVKRGYCHGLLSILHKMMTLLSKEQEVFVNKDWIEKMDSIKTHLSNEDRRLLKGITAKSQNGQSASQSPGKKKRKAKKRKMISEKEDVTVSEKQKKSH